MVFAKSVIFYVIIVTKVISFLLLGKRCKSTISGTRDTVLRHLGS